MEKTAPLGMFHYTCEHSREGIEETGFIYPAAALRKAKEMMQPLERLVNMTGQLVWLTDLPSIITLTRNQVGLTMGTLITCDRTECRFEVLTGGPPIYRWTELRERWPVDIVRELESIAGARPDHWFISRGPVPARFSPNHA